MDLRQIEQLVRNSRGEKTRKKNEDLESENSKSNSCDIDSASALQLFLDHIPVRAIPGIHNNSSSVVEIKTVDNVGDVICLLYEKNIYGALISENTDSGLSKGKFSEEYVGFLDFASIILWFVQEYENPRIHPEDDVIREIKPDGFFSMLEQSPHITQTKIVELAKSFLWDPFFPVRLEDTFFHVLMLLSKHRLHAVPVIKNSKVIGYITQNAVVHLLLQSSGLEWFDNIADRPISECRIRSEQNARIYGDQSLADALQVLWEKQIGALAVLQRETNTLIGSLRRKDLYLLLEDDLCINRKKLKIEDFIQMDIGREELNPTLESDTEAMFYLGSFHLINTFSPRMMAPVTCRSKDTLKQVMKDLIDMKSDFSFLLDESNRFQGLIALKDIIVQFAPPCIDSTIQGGGFFESAIKQLHFTSKSTHG